MYSFFTYCQPIKKIRVRCMGKEMETHEKNSKLSDEKEKRTECLHDCWQHIHGIVKVWLLFLYLSSA